MKLEQKANGKTHLVSIILDLGTSKNVPWFLLKKCKKISWECDSITTAINSECISDEEIKKVKLGKRRFSEIETDFEDGFSTNEDSGRCAPSKTTKRFSSGIISSPHMKSDLTDTCGSFCKKAKRAKRVHFSYENDLVSNFKKQLQV